MSANIIRNSKGLIIHLFLCTGDVAVTNGFGLNCRFWYVLFTYIGSTYIGGSYKF